MTVVINGTTVSSVLFLNGSTDYIELYAFQGTGGAINTNAIIAQTYLNGFLARAA